MRDDLSPRQIIDQALRAQKKRKRAERRAKKNVVAEAEAHTRVLAKQTEELMGRYEEIKKALFDAH